MTKTTLSVIHAVAGQAIGAEVPHPGVADLSQGDAIARQAAGASAGNTSNAVLVERLRAGDLDALEALLEKARPRLAAVALKIVRDRDDAEDVVQDAMLKVWRNVDRFEGRAALSTWLHRIVVNTAVDHLRARRAGAVASRGGLDQGSDRGVDGGPDNAGSVPQAVCADTPEDLLARAQLGAVVRGGIAQLSLVQQEVLALRELEGESYQSIAAIARCPVGTVMSRLHHARQRLAETLAPAGLELVRQAA